jgi:hypothetical protein
VSKVRDARARVLCGVAQSVSVDKEKDPRSFVDVFHKFPLAKFDYLT